MSEPTDPVVNPETAANADVETSDVSIPIRTIRVEGRLDALRAQPLRAELDAAAEGGINRIVVDLTDATFVDSAGLAALAQGMKRARQAGGDLRVVASQHLEAQRVFTLTRFDQVFVMGESAERLVTSW